MVNFFYSIFLFYWCLWNWQPTIRAEEAPAKRIIGGKPSVDDRSFFIYMIVYFVNTSTGILGRGDCGAALLNETHIVSAAHCVASEHMFFKKAVFRFKDFRIPNNSKFEEIEVGSRNVQCFNVSKYTKKVAERPDIAIFDLGRPVNELLKITRPTKLPLCPPKFYTAKPLFGKLGTVVGVGRTDRFNKSSNSKVLQEVTLEVTNTKSPCWYWLKSGFYSPEDVFCAVGVSCAKIARKRVPIRYENSRTTCYGDSGGPIFSKYNNGTPKCLFGIVRDGKEPVPSSRSLLEFMSPFHDGAGWGASFTSLQNLHNWERDGMFEGVNLWSHRELMKDKERRHFQQQNG